MWIFLIVVGRILPGISSVRPIPKLFFTYESINSMSVTSISGGQSRPFLASNSRKYRGTNSPSVRVIRGSKSVPLVMASRMFLVERKGDDFGTRKIIGSSKIGI